MNTRPLYCIATMDTKGSELQFVVNLLRKKGLNAISIDVGTAAPPQVPPDISRGQLASIASALLNKVIDPPWNQSDRGQALAAMSEILAPFLMHEAQHGNVAGVIGLGGSGGTALITAALRQLPIGLPKVMVSTVAAGDVGPYVDCSDIIMVPAIVDIAGLNRVSRMILSNAALALAGMIDHPPDDSPQDAPVKPATKGTAATGTVAMTMFGVTTPCVTAVREQLEQHGLETLVFHAVGTGGRTMEKLVESELVQGVLDLTTTEVADQIVGGVFPAGEHRLEAIVRRGIPAVFSTGALDMVNFRGLDTVPPQFRNRTLHVHNVNITLMRTTPAENRQCARFIAERLNAGSAPWTFLIPEKGVSALDAPGNPFFDPEADAALFEELQRLLKLTDTRKLVRLPLHINDPQFAAACVEEFLALWAVGDPRAGDASSP